MPSDPEIALAIAYAPPDARAALSALWALDERLAPLGLTTNGNLAISQIKLAWWAEALAALDQHPPPPEPLLGEIARTLLPRGVRGESLKTIVYGWSALIDGEDDAAIVARLADERGAGLFEAAARVLGASDMRVAAAGALWSLVDVMPSLPPEQAARAAVLARERLAAIGDFRWPRPLRPLGMLVVLARLDLAGRGRKGAPSRIARMIRHRVTGR